MQKKPHHYNQNLGLLWQASEYLFLLLPVQMEYFVVSCTKLPTNKMSKICPRPVDLKSCRDFLSKNHFFKPNFYDLTYGEVKLCTGYMRVKFDAN